MLDDSGDLLRQRRNLVTLSVGLIIFVLAQGHFKTSGGVLAFPVEFDNPSIVYYVMWILLAYFLWRYWIFGGKEAGDRMLLTIFHDMKDDAKYHKKLLSHYKKSVQDQASNKLKSNTIAGIDVSLLTVNTSDPRNRKKSKIVVTCEFEAKHGANDLKYTKTHNLRFFGLEGKVMIKYFFITAFKKQTFSDYVLPFLLCDIAAFLGGISAYLHYT
ncbi:MAG: hypothetical protein SVR94_10515 [Pseudomonadota bacterium]|nr:hypothetical protein [Pseudomonadota bacterium]